MPPHQFALHVTAEREPLGLGDYHPGRNQIRNPHPTLVYGTDR